MNLQEVGGVVATHRNREKLSMRRAAERAGISPTAWSDLEAGKHPPSLATQHGVASALRLRRDWFDVLSDAEPGTDVDIDSHEDATIPNAMDYLGRDVQLPDEIRKLPARVDRLALQIVELFEKQAEAADRVTELQSTIDALRALRDDEGGPGGESAAR